MKFNFDFLFAGLFSSPSFLGSSLSLGITFYSSSSDSFIPEVVSYFGLIEKMCMVLLSLEQASHWLCMSKQIE
jgi:hypothetical protein